MDFLVSLVGRTLLNLKTFLDGTEMMEDSLYEGQIRYIPEEVKEDKNFVEKIVYVSPIRHAEGNLYLSQILAYPEMYEQMLQVLKEYDEDIISINYDDNERRIGKGTYKILSKSNKKALPLNVYGDGMKKAILLMSAVIANWVIRNTLDYFTPMYDYFHRQLLKREFAMADETPLQVLHESGRRAQTKSYMWLFRSGEDGGFPIILYKYSETRAGNNAVEFLEGFKGYLMCDGYSGYNKVPDAKRTACWAHIRRYLTDAIPKGKQLDYTQPSVQGMMYINQLFHLEDVIKAKYSSFDAIKKARLEKEKPIVEGFLSWLDKQNPVRGSRMDKAVTYIQNRRSYLMTYLEDGHCSFSNNLSENAIRPFTVGRKNWLFCDTPNGAQASAIVYTMVEMAKANGVNVYHYLTYLLEKLPNDRMSDEELDRLAPWNEEVKAEIERRANDSNQ